MRLKAWQRVRDFSAVLGDPQQVLVQRLVEIAISTFGVGVERVIFGHCHATRIITLKAGVMVVSQHQAQPRYVHDIRISQPIAFVSFCAKDD